MNIITSQEAVREKSMNDEELNLRLPNSETIPCLTCKWGMMNFLAEFCFKYKLKPKEVYFESKPCEHYEPIK